MKLSKRLQQISQMVAADYQHIWDCCCDHGLLGAALLERTDLTARVHFVDIVSALMSELEGKLRRFYPNAPWQTHCLDVAHLPLGEYSGRHLVIIAGVGGDLITHFVTALAKRFPALELDFLLCPVHHQYALRHSLIALNFGLRQERLVEENQRYYELLLVKTHSGRAISPVGEHIWQADSPAALECARGYLSKTLKHYQRMAKGSPLTIAPIIDAYAAVKLS